MNRKLPRLHAITDERTARRSDFDAVARALADGGGSDLAIHARGGRGGRGGGHALTGREHYNLAVRLSVLPSLLFVNDRLDIALAVPAAGVQLRHDSLAVSAARALNPRWWIGKSVHDLADAEAAKTEGADYLVVGPLYPSASHPDVSPLGLERLHAIASLGLPVIAIGGITPERVREAQAAGAYGVAAIRALWDDAEPLAAAGRFREVLR